MRTGYTLARRATRSKPAQYIVKVGGSPVGLVEKHKNSKTDKHPWKAFIGLGETEFIGAFYPDQGGLKTAVDTVISHASEIEPQDYSGAEYPVWMYGV